MKKAARLRLFQHKWEVINDTRTAQIITRYLSQAGPIFWLTLDPPPSPLGYPYLLFQVWGRNILTEQNWTIKPSPDSPHLVVPESWAIFLALKAAGMAHFSQSIPGQVIFWPEEPVLTDQSENIEN